MLASVTLAIIGVVDADGRTMEPARVSAPAETNRQRRRYHHHHQHHRPHHRHYRRVNEDSCVVDYLKAAVLRRSRRNQGRDA